jgi:cell wall-associated NlpC family hydrolase
MTTTLKRGIAAAAIVLLAIPGSAAAKPARTDAKRREARALMAKVEQAGERLSRATEMLDQARLRRSKLDAKLASAKYDLGQSEGRLAQARRQFGHQAKLLYMQPTAWLSLLFGTASLADYQRAHLLAGRAVGSAEDAMLAIRRAKADQQAQVTTVKRVRAEARARELDIEKQQRDAAAAYSRVRQLLRGVNAELGAIIEADRRTRLAAAGALAAARIREVGPARPQAVVAVRAAASQIGKPYHWGADGPESYDCSGLTMYAWGAAGVRLPHSSQAQYSSLPLVPLSALQPGDLVFSGSPIHHVAIYAGNGRIIHSPQTGESVREESLYNRRIVGAARP